MGYDSIKNNNKPLRVKSGWPVTCQIIYGNKGHVTEYTMKEDMRMFNVSDIDLAQETGCISHKRIYNIKQNCGSPANMEELHKLTLAFNRIIAKRLNTKCKIKVFGENNLPDN